MILLDTSGLLAALFPDQRQHRACADVIRAAGRPLVLSPLVLAELDYLVTKLAGVDTELALLDEVGREAYRLEPFGALDVLEAREIIEQWRGSAIGLADASIVVLSRRLQTNEILTLDERHFRVLKGHDDRPFHILPTDR